MSVRALCVLGSLPQRPLPSHLHPGSREVLDPPPSFRSSSYLFLVSLSGLLLVPGVSRGSPEKPGGPTLRQPCVKVSVVREAGVGRKKGTDNRPWTTTEARERLSDPNSRVLRVEVRYGNGVDVRESVLYPVDGSRPGPSDGRQVRNSNPVSPVGPSGPVPDSDREQTMGTGQRS